MWICTNCERELKYAGQWHNCVKVSIESLFVNKSEELTYIFDQLLAAIAAWEDVVVSATKNCIVFVHRQTFLVVKPMKTKVDLKFYSAEELVTFALLKTTACAGRYEHHIRLSALDELTPALYIAIRHSYELL